MRTCRVFAGESDKTYLLVIQITVMACGREAGRILQQSGPGAGWQAAGEV